MKNQTILYLAIGAGVLYFLTREKAPASNPSSPDPIPQVPGENLTDSSRMDQATAQKWRGGASSVAGHKIKIQ